MALARTFLIVAALCAAAAAHADAMYKWVDEKGVTHFSSDPPPDGKGQKIDVKPAPPSSSKAPQRADDWSVRASELRQERLDKEKKEEAAKRQVDESKSRCLSAQRNLDQLNSGRRLYTVNERGERVYMDDKAYSEQARKAQDNVKAYCPR